MALPKQVGKDSLITLNKRMRTWLRIRSVNDSRDLPPDAVIQAPLFSELRVVQRLLGNGTLVRVCLLPVAEGQVRIMEYQRRDREGKWQRRSEEEGRTVSFASLGLKAEFDELFGI